MAIKERLSTVPVLGTALRVNDAYKENAGNQFAAAVAFFGFLSLLPLLLVALSVTAFVLSDDPGRTERVVQGLAGSIPGLSATIQPIVAGLIENRGTVGLLGLAGLILSGLRVMDSASVATSRVYGFAYLDESGVALKLRQAGAAVLLGLLGLLGVAAGVTPGVDLAGPVSVLLSVGGSVLSVGFDLVLFLAAYRVLAVGEGPRLERLWPGALLAAAGWTGLKVFGAEYVAGQVASTNALYGAFGTTIGLLLLFYLAARIYLYGAELNVILRVDPEADVVDESVPAVERLPDVDDLPALVPVGAAPAAPRLGSTQPSPTVSDATAMRLESADRVHRGEPTPVRRAAAFAVTAAALGGLFKVMRPDRDA